MGKPLEHCTSIISRIIWVRTNMSMAKMCTSMRGTMYYSVFHYNTPGSQDIVADATIRYQVWVSSWNIAPQLSQEPFELEQICQWLKCAPRWEEQCIYREFHCSTPGSHDIVADATNRYQVWVSRWNIAPQLSQEPFELEQICQWLKCAPRWEEQSINRVFHCSTPGSQDKLADATNRYRVY